MEDKLGFHIAIIACRELRPWVRPQMPNYEGFASRLLRCTIGTLHDKNMLSSSAQKYVQCLGRGGLRCFRDHNYNKGSCGNPILLGRQVFVDECQMIRLRSRWARLFQVVQYLTSLVWL